jgi:hypothetical protein
MARTKHKATVRDLVEFKKAVTCMNDKYPFSHAFGHVSYYVLSATIQFDLFHALILSPRSIAMQIV